MLLSVVITTYNNSETIKALLKSIIDENPLSGRYEIIISDDCSSDNTLEVARRHLENEKVNFLILRNDKNNGFPGKGLNEGFLRARGKYIHFVDGDDAVVNKGYERLNGATEDLMIFEYYIYDRHYKSIVKKTLRDYQIVDGEYCEKNRILITYWDCIIKKSFLDKKELRFEEKTLVQDTLFMNNLMRKKPEVSHVNQPLYIYMINHNSVSTKRISNKVINAFKETFRTLDYGLAENKVIFSRVKKVLRRSMAVRLEEESEFEELLSILDEMFFIIPNCRIKSEKK